MRPRDLLRELRGNRPPTTMAPVRYDDALAELARRRIALAARGTCVWGYVTIANQSVWRGSADNPASVIYSFDPWFEGHPRELAPIATRVARFYGSSEPAGDPALRVVQDRIREGTGRYFGARLPPAITGGRVVFESTLLIWLKDLPGGRLVDHLVPLWVDADGYAMVVVGRAWPDALRVDWEAEAARRRAQGG